ncbi:MAG TPA: hypothetical protein DCM08_11715 [Microscillaceae bacterium]|nr:hypothetical protein [Microscillaceae bacterium]
MTELILIFGVINLTPKQTFLFAMQTPLRIELPAQFAHETVNVYAFTEPELTLIDSGEANQASWEALQQGLVKAGLSVNEVRKIIITHAHVDHIGMAAQIAEASGAEIWVSDLVYDWAAFTAEKWQSRVDFLQVVFQKAQVPEVWYKPVIAYLQEIPAKWLPIPEKYLRRFSLQDTLSFAGNQWQVMHAPGHSASQTCFFQPDTQQFFSADMLLPITPVAVIEQEDQVPQKRVPGLVQMVESFEKITQMPIAVSYPGHGEPFADHQGLIAKQVARIHQRKNQCLEVVRAGVEQAFDIARKLYADASPTMLFSGFAMTLGYLDLLAAEGLVVQHDTPQGWRFEAVAQKQV